ncbi:metalloregulator ArsR/SmtB family transcription factor [Rothia sp. AR01]|uniref:Metalloregulator ArsR/SmtB family transcription factor n=1 Tax=Rothia santali TaxID=2949643 RepID=A0A9X2HJX9_9MICC|nr:metalloregulator ArsR/SmtB family transcription factor [Rothia santali]MCP3425653.1 metalloregulator ArsR/SmtB family transcription factor [Rothia santali]
MTAQTTPDAHVATLARLGNALSHEMRARILLALRRGPARPSDLCERLGASKQAMSNQLACLRGCGLVTARQVGRGVEYRLGDPRLAHALEDVLGMAVIVDPACCSGEGCSCR